jgi:hypothetical protein
MNSRLQEIIKYKTGGRKTAFAELMGWTPQYLAKLLNGENFGLQPVLSILEKLPEINARWFLFGQGSMLEIGKMFDLQRETMNHIQELLDLDKYIPYMSPEELHQFDESSPVIFLEYARHGVFFRSYCNLLSEERQPHSGVYSPLLCPASLPSSISIV